MARLLDKIIVIDIESTCWNGSEPAGMKSDIIEFGICLLDVKTGEISDNRGILVKPERSSLSDFCTELTTITPRLIENHGIPFKEACAMIRKEYSGQSRVWASFGAYDLKQIRQQCADMEVGYPLSPSHINVKTLFALKKQLEREKGMDGALELLGIPLEGTHHRGIDDAKNIAKILRWILDKK